MDRKIATKIRYKTSSTTCIIEHTPNFKSFWNKLFITKNHLKSKSLEP